MQKYSYLKASSLLVFLFLFTLLSNLSCMKKLTQLQEIEREESNNPVSFIALSTDGGVSLSWTPSHLAVDGYFITREVLDNKRPSKGPVSGVQYTIGEKLGAGKVVYIGSAPQFTDTTAVSGTGYRYLLFSYVLANANYNYFYLDSSVANATGTVSATTSSTVRRPTSISVSARSGALKLTWTADGNQTGFLLVRRPNILHVSDANVKFKPTNGVVYSVGQDLGDGEVVVYEGAELSYDDTNLLNGLQQRYSLFAYNAERVYSEPYGIFRAPLASILGEPTLVAQAGDKSVLLSWYTGGVTITSVMVLRKSVTTNNEVTSVPIQGNMYSAGMTFGNQTVVYVGSGTTAIDTGLINNTKYYYTIYLVTGNVYKLLQVKAIATPLANTISPIKHEDNTSGGSSGGVSGVLNGGSSGSSSDSIGGDPGQCVASALTIKTPKTMTAHTGVPFPWEGKKYSKNLQHSFNAGLAIVLNSVDTNGDYGLGTPGLRFDVDGYIKKTSPSEATIIRGDGSESFFQRTSCEPPKWESRNKLISRNVLTEKENNRLLETIYRGGTEFEYAPLSGSHYALSSVKDANANTITFARNSAGHIESITDSLTGQVITISYSGGKANTVSYSCGPQYSLEYDLAGRLSKITYPDASNILIEYEDGSSLITAITDTLGAKSQYRYYSNGTIKKMVNPYNYSTTYTYTPTEINVSGFANLAKDTYNANGALVQSVENGINISYGRDELNQLTSVTNHFEQVTTYTYNTEQYLIGIQDPTGVSTGLIRDERGNVTRAAITGPGKSFLYSFTYFENNLLKSASGPGGTTAYAYDSSGNPTAITKEGRMVAQASYTKGLPDSVTDQYGITSNFQYDAHSSLSYLSNVWGTVNQTNTACGQVTTRQAAGISSNFDYDNMGRQISESYAGPSNKSWSSQTSYSISGGLSANRALSSKVKTAELGGSLPDYRGEAPQKNYTTSILDSAGNTSTTNVGKDGYEQFTNGKKTGECEGCKRQSSVTGN